MYNYQYAEPKQGIYKNPDNTFEIVSLGNKITKLSKFEAVCYICANDAVSVEEVKSNICKYYKFTEKPLEDIRATLDKLIAIGLLENFEIKKELHKHVAFNKNILKDFDMAVDRRTILSLSEIELSITDLCPFNCTYCSKKEHESSKDYISVERWKEVITEAYELGVNGIKITGGEPLHPSIIQDSLDVLNFAKKTGFERIVILTSGFGLVDNIQEIVEAGVTEISISYNMISQYVEDRIRNKYVEDHIKSIIALKEYNIQLCLCCVVNSESIKLVNKVIEFAIENGFSCIHFYPVMPTGGAKDYWEEIKLSVKELSNFMDYLEVEKRRLSKIIVISAEQMYMNSSDDIRVGCEAANHWVYLSEDGFVSSCACGEISNHNIKGESLKSIWRESEYFRAIREFTDDTCCTQCTERKYCVNNCLIRLSQAANNSLAYGYSKCKLIKNANS